MSSSDWQFEKGETLVEEQENQPSMPGLEGVEVSDPTEYTVKRRLTDSDEDGRFYWLEYERQTQGGKSVENTLYSEKVVEMHYRSVDTATDQQEGSDDV